MAEIVIPGPVIVATLLSPPYPESIRHLVAKTWVKTYVKSMQYRHLTYDYKLYFNAMHPLVDRILGHPRTVLVVAHYEGATDHVVGYAVMTRDMEMVEPVFALHMVWVKPKYRSLGAAKTLLEGAPIDRYTHLPEPTLRPCMPSDWVYDAFAFFQTAYSEL